MSPNYYAIIPAEVRYNKNLPHLAKLLYGEITSLCSKTGECWATNEYFAALYNCSPRNIRRLISLLNDYKYVTIKFIYKEKSKEIEKRTISINSLGREKNDSTWGQEYPEGEDKNGHMCEDNNVLDNNINNINNTSINKALLVPSKKRVIFDNNWQLQFEKFWKEYPRKEKKTVAKKWFEKNKPDENLFELIMNKLAEFKETNDWKKNNGEFIPHPSTWLNQSRWEDEIKSNNVDKKDDNIANENAEIERRIKEKRGII